MELPLFSADLLHLYKNIESATKIISGGSFDKSIETKQDKFLEELREVLQAKQTCIKDNRLQKKAEAYKKNENEMYQHIDQLYKNKMSLKKIMKEFNKSKDELVNSPEAKAFFTESLKKCLGEIKHNIDFMIRWFEFQCKDLKSQDKCDRVKQLKKINMKNITMSEIQQFEKIKLAI
jgi:hypothetical protein